MRLPLALNLITLLSAALLSEAAWATPGTGVEHFKVGIINAVLVNSAVDDDVVVEAIIHVGNGTENTAPNHALDVALYLASQNGNPGLTQHLLTQTASKLETGSDVACSFLRLVTSRDHLLRTLPAFATALRRPVFNGDELAIVRKNALDGIRESLADPRREGYGVAERLVFGNNHPVTRALDTRSTFAELPRIETEDLHSLFSRWIRPDNLTFLVVGKLTSSEAQELLDPYFEEWHPPREPLSPPLVTNPVQHPNAPRVFLINVPGMPYARIETVSVFDPSRVSERSRVALVALSKILSGSPEARLDLAIQSVKPDITKEPGLTLSLVGAQPTLATTAYAANWNVGATLHVMRQAFDELVTTRPPSPEQIAALQSEIQNEEDLMRLPTTERASRYHDLFMLGLADDEYTILHRELAELTPEKLQATGRLLGLHNSITWLVFGNAGQIEPQLHHLMKVEDFGTLTVLPQAPGT